MESNPMLRESELADMGVLAPDQNEQELSHDAYSEYVPPDLGPDAFRSLYRNTGSDRFWMSDESAESVASIFGSMSYVDQARTIEAIRHSVDYHDTYSDDASVRRENMIRTCDLLLADHDLSFMMLQRIEMVRDSILNLREYDLDGMHIARKGYMNGLPVIRYDKNTKGSVQERIEEEDIAYLNYPTVVARVKEVFFPTFDIREYVPTEIREGGTLSLFETLDGHERYYFLKFIRERKQSEIDTMSRFIRSMGPAGVRALIASEYDPSISTMLVELSNHVDDNGDPFENEKIWELSDAVGLFGVLVDHANSIATLIRPPEHEPDSPLPDYEMWNLETQMHEAIVRKASDLLRLYAEAALKRDRLEASGESIGHADGHSSADIVKAMKHFLYGLSVMEGFFDEYQGFTFDELEQKTGQMPKFQAKDILGRTMAVKWFIRENADTSGQARINFEIDFMTDNPNPEALEFFRQTTIRKKDGKVENESVFRIAIDRDTTDPGNPRLSLDVCRAEYHGTTFDRTGDRLGNMFATASHEANHTPYSFDPMFAEADTFGQLAHALRMGLDERFAYHREAAARRLAEAMYAAETDALDVREYPSPDDVIGY